MEFAEPKLFIFVSYLVITWTVKGVNTWVSELPVVRAKLKGSNCLLKK